MEQTTVGVECGDGSGDNHQGLLLRGERVSLSHSQYFRNDVADQEMCIFQLASAAAFRKLLWLLMVTSFFWTFFMTHTHTQFHELLARRKTTAICADSTSECVKLLKGMHLLSVDEVEHEEDGVSCDSK